MHKSIMAPLQSSISLQSSIWYVTCLLFILDDLSLWFCMVDPFVVRVDPLIEELVTQN
ncbi:hypothetical protein HanHA300_Chr14g0539421 [Helianthus annuus]|nr:hypothetical protein HanHA300_Chr14g0539421 [Helianthus annuus]KAJ0470392.1 hypothetical protein HanIR_Chr14g0718271 [Helianthus annuus]KAJ0487140.1 hypothetical protein HanHA89_Chr14g0587191 [Helianthus annuus]